MAETKMRCKVCLGWFLPRLMSALGLCVECAQAARRTA
jgi:hypothetical protein